MSKKTLFFTTFLFLFPTSSFACMPHTPSSLIIGEYKGINQKGVPQKIDQNNSYKLINLDNTGKLFQEYGGKVGKNYIYDTDIIDFSKFSHGDTLITISDYQNGDYDTYFTVFEVGKITCKDDVFNIESVQGTIQDFGKSIWQCGNYRPDDVLSKNELLQKIQDELKSCDTLEKEAVINIAWYKKIILWFKKLLG